MPSIDDTEGGEVKPSGDVCPGCLHENPERAPFCHRCGMPIGMTATLDPIHSIYSMGWGYRRAISGGRSWMRLLGMWAIFGPVIILIGWAFFAFMRRANFGDHLVRVSLVLLYGLVCVTILYRMTRSFIRQYSIKPGHCQKCGYNLSHLTEPRCPECGTSFDPEQLPRDLAWSAEQEELRMDTAHISTMDHPIDCAKCGSPLYDGGETGQCAECGEPYSRADRLVDRYGPEVMLGDAAEPVVATAGIRPYRRALWLTLATAVAIAVARWLVHDGMIGEDRSHLVWLLLVPTLLEWFKALRPQEPDGAEGAE